MVKIKKPPKWLIFTALGILVLAVAGGAYYWLQVRTKPQVLPSDPTVNLAPPTQEDAQRVEDNKQKIVQQQEQEGNRESTPTGTKQTVKPTIIYAGQYGGSVEVGAEVAVFEDGGTCTATFTSGSSTLTRSVQGVRNVNRVTCPTITVNTAEFNPKGSWSVTVTYDSTSTAGTSNPQTIAVE